MRVAAGSDGGNRERRNRLFEKHGGFRQERIDRSNLVSGLYDYGTQSLLGSRMHDRKGGALQLAPILPRQDRQSHPQTGDEKSDRYDKCMISFLNHSCLPNT
ncbi:hypothetical protein SAMN06269301_2148 [Geobacter sp. DSM 9736]|nr:hypothetical protein SAMN06269301_2148 [Geobacter sp. DSM 9736]